MVSGLHGTPLEINGMADHVHVLARIRPVISISEFLCKFKSISSGRARRQTWNRFKWQVKYGAFTVSQSQLEHVQNYIRNQEAHHARISFEEEFKAVLTSNGIEFEEQYLWESLLRSSESLRRPYPTLPKPRIGLNSDRCSAAG